jgi:hypothetical protein
MIAAGIYRMIRVEERKSEGSDWTSQPFVKGILAMGMDGSISLNQQSAGHSLFSYLGQARYEGGELLIEVVACSIPETVGQVMRRRVSHGPAGELVLFGVSLARGVEFQITWERIE